MVVNLSLMGNPRLHSQQAQQQQELETDDESALFQPIFVGDMELLHRVVMAPLSSRRAGDDHVPLAEFYSQRASVAGTLLISEATLISPDAGGFEHLPGIWSDKQLVAWRQVAEAVHEKQSFMFLQLCALGTDKPAGKIFTDGYLAPHCITPSTSSNPDPDARPRALNARDIKKIIQQYVNAAENAINHSGFDGVEIHGADGCLPEQFLQDASSSMGTDGYCGSIENRARFTLEVLGAVTASVGAKKTALKLSSWNLVNGATMADVLPMYTYLIEEIRQRHPDLAYLHVTGRPTSRTELGQPATSQDSFAVDGEENDFIRRIWSAEGKRLITAGGYTRDTGMKVADMKGDIVAYGRLFMSNPDLPFRLRNDLPINQGGAEHHL